MIAESSYPSAQKPNTYSCPAARWTQSMPNPLETPFLLSFRLHQGFPSFHLPWVFPTKNLYGCLICRIPATFPANLILLIRPPNNIVEEYNSWRWSWYSLLHSTASSPFLGPNTILRAYSNTHSLCVPSVEEIEVSQPHKQETRLTLPIF